MQAIANLVHPILRLLQCGAPLADLGIRLWVSWVFYKSALTKVSVSSEFPFVDVLPFTIILFENEYSVPFLSATAAAYLGSYAEFFLPIFIALGLFGRGAAVALFAFNIVAVMALPEARSIDLQNHFMWGLMLLLTVTHGPGKISIDHLIRRKYY